MTIARTSFPIGFSFYNADEEPVIYITADVAGQAMTLEITNTSDRPLVTLDLPEAASPGNHHFELVFRPGTLYNNPAAVTLDSANFEMAMNRNGNGAILPNADGTLSLYFRVLGQLTLQEGEKLVIPLSHIRAAAEGGTRGSHLLLKYRNLAHAGLDGPISGFRSLLLNVVNHQGKRSIPLHAGFLDANTVLNDGQHPNTLRLRLTNSARHEETLGDSGSRLALVVEGGEPSEEWTLATTGQLEGLDVKVTYPGEPATEVTRKGLEWPMAFRPLAPGESIDIELSNLVTAHTGLANLYLYYSDVPGYWNGRFVLPVQKTPLVVKGKNVGIGTTTPGQKLSVVGDLGITGDVTMGSESAPATLSVLGNVNVGTPGFLGWQLSVAAYVDVAGPVNIVGRVNISTQKFPNPYDNTVLALHVPEGTDGLLVDSSYGTSVFPDKEGNHYLSGKGVIFRHFDLRGGTGYSDKVKLDLTNGRVEVNGQVHVNGGVYAQQGLYFYGSSVGSWLQINPTIPGGFLVGTGATLSDTRLKTGLRSIHQALDKVLRLHGRSYEWSEAGLSHLTRDIEQTLSAGPEATAEDNAALWAARREEAYRALRGPKLGLVAQEVEAVLPELVEEDRDGYKHVHYQQLTGLLVEAIKEQQGLIQTLLARLAVVEARA